MKLHAKAALTVSQRQQVRRLYLEQHLSLHELARQFHTSVTTIKRWVNREDAQDRSCAPHAHAQVLTPEYRQAVVQARAAHPEHGPVRLAQDLADACPQATPSTIWRILKQERLSQRLAAPPKVHRPIPVGRHRVQMDLQQLPAVAGGKGFEYKISAIHLKTRMKYSEIHPNHESATVAGVLERALGRLPPFGWWPLTTPWSSR